MGSWLKQSLLLVEQSNQSQIFKCQKQSVREKTFKQVTLGLQKAHLCVLRIRCPPHLQPLPLPIPPDIGFDLGPCQKKLADQDWGRADRRQSFDGDTKEELFPPF